MLDVLPSVEQDEITDVVARALTDLYPINRLDHGRRPASLSSDDWSKIADLGWLALTAPTGIGGAGYDLTYASLVHRLFGRHLMTQGLTATVVALRLAANQGDLTLAGRLASGKERAAFAVLRSSDGDHRRVRLFDDSGAQLLVLLTREGACLLRSECLIERNEVASVDTTVPLAHAVMRDAFSELRADREAGRWAHVLIASELVGIAEATLEMATEYAKVRQQFGKPIGSFQAVAHLCADCAMSAEAASAQINLAAIAVRDNKSDAEFQVSAAAQLAADGAFKNATSNIQVHGGMGFSAECNAHLYLKRALVLRVLLDEGLDRQAILLRFIGG
jgi:alkylation response protein AidB-like acyl-CoA dehydrogenase